MAYGSGDCCGDLRVIDLYKQCGRAVESHVPQALVPWLCFAHAEVMHSLM